ncbi:CAP domain-containing protein [Paenibacillus polysaccharolyticus]|uniref:CAP domain-containing protein n=1 Tax=Paenibacillus polysaccharolyticus TaxID=582692 RepID=UPI00209FAC07|nr:CAP domain-containing protein [Paenibacillus polysaccharolyticus]MCP1135923.1 CAP domain-containing protein [Paenibacillus polysaccharolyticus]
MFIRKKVIRTLLTLPLAGLMFVLLGAQQTLAAPVDSLLPERSQQEINQKWTQWMSNKDQPATYIQPPSTTAPYVAGVLSESSLQQALNAANFYRYLSGLEGDLVLDATLNVQAQHGAVLVSTGPLSHFPARPADMPKDFFDLGAKSASSSNLYASYGAAGNLAVKSVEAYMDDSDASNIGALGHRRWILSPQLKKVGFGLASRDNKNYASHFSTMQVMDTSRAGKLRYNYNLYPNKGAFPIEAFNVSQAWSAQLNPDVFAKPSTSEVQVELTRTSDQKTWNFGAKTPVSSDPAKAFFNVNTDGYGYSYAVIFRPDNLNALKDGDTFTVRITGLKKKDGSNADIVYQTQFFTISPSAEEPVTDPENPGTQPQDPGTQPEEPDTGNEVILDDRHVQFEYTAERTLNVRGTLTAYAGQTFSFQIHGPSPEEKHIRTETVTVGADGRFNLTVRSLGVSDLNIYLQVSPYFMYLIPAASNSDVTYYFE